MFRVEGSMNQDLGFGLRVENVGLRARDLAS